MPKLISKPTIIAAEGSKPKVIEEFIGRVASGDEPVSIARMKSPAGWEEPGQTPEFDEYTVVLSGVLRVTSRTGAVDVRAGQAVITRKGEWVRYSTPGGAEYIAVCVPAFSPATAHRDAGESRIVTRVETAQPADFGALAALNAAAYEGFARFLEPGAWERLRTDVTSVEPRARTTEFLVIRDGGRIIGSVGYGRAGGGDPALFESHMANLSLLAVDPRYRGLGIGRELTEAGIERARRDGAFALALLASEQMRIAQHLARSLGFSQDKELPPRHGLKYARFVLPLKT